MLPIAQTILVIICLVMFFATMVLVAIHQQSWYGLDWAAGFVAAIFCPIVFPILVLILVPMIVNEITSGFLKTLIGTLVIYIMIGVVVYAAGTVLLPRAAAERQWEMQREQIYH